MLVENIAIADLGYTLTVILPTIISSAADSWVLGHFLCKFCALFQFVFGTANVLMICALNVCKLSCLLWPMRARIQTRFTGYVLVGFLWLATFIYPIQLVALNRELVYNNYLYRCMSGSRIGTVWEYLELINIGILVFIPLLTIIITSLWLLAFVHKVGGLSKQGLIVILSVSFVFILSYCPLLMYNMCYLFTNPEVSFFKFGIFMVYISSASNPFLYILTSRSFKDFVWGTLKRKPFLLSKQSDTGR